VSRTLLAEFAHPGSLRRAAQSAERNHCRVVDAFTPFPVEGLADVLETRASNVRISMFAGGILVAALAYGGEFYTAVIDYPYNSGGRPLNAWPAFMLVPFATGILGASIAGLIRFLFETGLPRLHFPLFAVEGFERASQDRFWLALEAPEWEAERRRAMDWLRRAGALSVREAEP
jgi:Protein of unknown function (DUF3341)